MSENVDPVKQNIIDWCNEDGIQVLDQSDANPQFAWSVLLTKKVMVYKQPNLLDRIYVQSQIDVSPKHQTLIRNNQQIRNNLLLQLPAMASQNDINLTFRINNDVIEGISLFKINFHSTISKADFLRLFLRVEQIHSSVLNQLRTTLGLDLQQEQQRQQVGSENPLSS
ncbi:MAG: DUF2299 family protein [Thaumarchaeota archaeon]|nr:DUF2299 family protein [Nitrososphaerota archaeon]